MAAFDDTKSFLEDFVSSITSNVGRPVSSVRTAKKLIEMGEDPVVAAQNFETGALAKGWSAPRIARKTRRILDTPLQPIPAEKYTYGPTLVERAYQTFYGRNPTQDEISRNLSYAGAMRTPVGDPGAFQSFMTESILASPEGMAKIKTPDDIEWERKYGPIARNASGELQRGMLLFRPEKVAAINKQLQDVAFSPIAGMNLSI